jgi:hypothetical protein
MATRAIPPFDPARDFIVDREGWLCGGRRYRRGEAFRKLGITPRNLKLFFEQRIIRFADPSESEKRGPIAVPIDVTKGPLANKPAKVPDADEAIEALVDGQTLADLKSNAEILGLDISKLRTKRQLATAIVESGNGAT